MIAAPRPCLSVVVPCYDEATTVLELLRRVLASPWVAEVIVVDDGSTDGTREILAEVSDPMVRVIFHEHNQGKGAALRTGFAAATADYVIVQDADLEYDPAEYGELMAPLEDDRADVVYGSRFVSSRPHRVLYFWHSLGNRLLTLAVEHVHRPEPHRHGDLLQGVPPRGDPGDRHPRRTGSASSPR